MQKTLDREQRDRYVFFVYANGQQESTEGLPLDMQNNAVLSSTSKEDITRITIHVLDVNDNGASFDQDEYITTVPYDAALGQAVIRVHATDPDLDDMTGVEYR